MYRFISQAYRRVYSRHNLVRNLDDSGGVSMWEASTRGSGTISGSAGGTYGINKISPSDSIRAHLLVLSTFL